MKRAYIYMHVCSRCWKLWIRIGVQKNLQNIRCSMEHCEGLTQQLEKMGHQTQDVLPKFRRRKLIRELAKRSMTRSCKNIWQLLLTMQGWNRNVIEPGNVIWTAQTLTLDVHNDKSPVSTLLTVYFQRFCTLGTNTNTN